MLEQRCSTLLQGHEVAGLVVGDKVEVGVQVAERWLLARIRNETFASLAELNRRLSELTEIINTRTMRAYKASRRELFERLDKPALGPLPAEPFQPSAWKRVALNIDYHVEFEGHLYSVPHTLLREELWVRATASSLEASVMPSSVTDACIEGIDFQRERQLEKAVVRQLVTCRWVSEHQTVLVTGATGTGKSHFACALAHQACRKGFRALYRRVPRLFDELRLARADGTYQRFLSRLAKLDVLVLDDFAISPLTEESRRDLLEILEDRYGLRATVITSQLKHDLWHDYLADPTVADAICDRVLHGAHKVALAGPSRRKFKANPASD